MQEQATAVAESYDRPSVEVEQGSSVASEHGEDAGSRKRTASVSANQRPAKVLKSSDGSDERWESSVAARSEGGDQEEKELEGMRKQLKIFEEAKNKAIGYYKELLGKLNAARDENDALHGEHLKLWVALANVKKGDSSKGKSVDDYEVLQKKLQEADDENDKLRGNEAQLQVELAKLKRSKGGDSADIAKEIKAGLKKEHEEKLSELRESHEAAMQDLKDKCNKRVNDLKRQLATAEKVAKAAKGELSEREKEIKREKLDFKRELRQEQQEEIKKYKPETSAELKEKSKAISEYEKNAKAYKAQIKQSGEEIGELKANIQNNNKWKQQACQRIKGLQDIVKQKEDFIDEMGRGYNDKLEFEKKQCAEKLKFEGDRWAKLQECHAETKVMLTAQQRANFNLRNGVDSLSVKYAKLLAEVTRQKGASPAMGQGSAGRDGQGEGAGKEKDEKGGEASEDDASTGVAGMEKEDGSQTSASSAPPNVKQTQAASGIFDGKTSPSSEKADTPVSEQASTSMEDNDEFEVVQSSKSLEQAEVDTTPSSEEKSGTAISEASAPKNYQDSTFSREEGGSSEAMDVDGDSEDQKQVSASISPQGGASSDAGGEGRGVESGRPIWARKAVVLREGSTQFETTGWSAPLERSKSVREGSDDMGMEE